MSRVQVRLWGRTIGAVALREGVGVFQYDPAFARSGIEVAPLTMPLSPAPRSFPGLPTASFHGLPGLLADSLPDRYGNALIDAWLARQGRTPASFDAVERLAYTGSRGMGALEYTPATGPKPSSGEVLAVDALHALASEVLTDRAALSADLGDRTTAMGHLLRVGTSAGGARAKALVAWNPTTNVLRSGQVDPGDGFEHWLLKFDGVRGNRDKELEDPAGYGAVEFAYHRLAVAAGITMAPCHLLEEGGRRHFMTRRFDRPASGGKLHLQSLAALAHLDFNAAGAHSYEQAFQVLQRLGLGMAAKEQLFRRMAFNVVARNQDDHVKNIAFLMDRRGRWTLAPAYDLTWAYNPDGAWTSRHQMSLSGKREGFEVADFEAVGRLISLKRGRARALLAEVTDAVRAWPQVASEVGVDAAWAASIGQHHRVEMP